MRDVIKRFTSHSFVRNTFVMQLAAISQAGTYLITSVLTARMLGETQLGRWTTSSELYLFVFTLMNMGLARAATSMYAKAHGAGDRGAATQVLGALLKIGVIMVVSIVAIGQLVAPGLAEHLYEDRAVGQFAATLCIASVAEIARALALAALTGSGQMKRYAVFDMTANVLRVVTIGGAVLLHPTVSTVVAAYLLHAGIITLLAVRAYNAARREGGETAPPAWGTLAQSAVSAPLGPFFGLSSMLALGKTMQIAVSKVGMLLIPAVALTLGRDDGMADAGIYKVGMVLNLVLTYGVGAVSTTLLPTLGMKLGGSDVPITQRGGLLKKIALTSGGITAALTLLSIPAMWLVVTYAYGPGYEAAFDYYCLLAVGNLFLGTLVITDPFYIYAGRLGHSVVQNVVYSVICLALIVTGSRLYGPMGVAAATGLSPVVAQFHLVYIWIFFRRQRAKTPVD